MSGAPATAATAAAAAAAASAAFPTTLSGYSDLEEVGRGASSVVYKGRCVSLDNLPVAIKVIDLDTTALSFEEMRREIHIMKESRHPNLIMLYTSFTEDHYLYIVLQYCSRGSVSDLARRRPLAEALIATILREALQGLEYLHSHNRIHRDVKGANILIDDSGHVMLSDFGVSAVLDRQTEKRSTFVGTPFWMAPEVVGQKQYDCRADIWSLGITAIELATGRAPNSHMEPMEAMLATLQQEAPQLEKESASREMRDMVKRCLEKDPDKRPTATKLLQHKFFKFAQDSEYVRQKLVLGSEEITKVYKAKAARPSGTGQSADALLQVGAWSFGDSRVLEDAPDSRQMGRFRVSTSQKTQQIGRFTVAKAAAPSGGSVGGSGVPGVAPQPSSSSQLP